MRMREVLAIGRQSPLFCNPWLIPAPLVLPPHNTHYGQEQRLRVEKGGVSDGPLTKLKRRCRILLPFPRCRFLLPAARAGGLCMRDRGQAGAGGSWAIASRSRAPVQRR